jgi:NAD(P)-dependent dehydrogenase (short-subunit alcohol dehydrogenase family)
MNSPVAVVTGGGTGIGLAVAARLIADGFAVAVTFRESRSGADSLMAEVAAAGRVGIALECDVRDPESVRRFFAEVRSRLGPVSVLVNNAAVAIHRPFVEISEDEWDNVLGTNLGGAYRCTQHALPDMLTAGDGVIVNVVSELAFVGEAGLASYVSSKAGLIGLTKSLAREFGPRGIRVNAVAPGPTDTRMLTAEERTPDYVRTIPLRRLGTPEEIAATVAFLSSADARWYSGQVLSPNGGTVMP